MKTSAPALYVGYEHHAFFFSTFFIHNPFLLLRTYYLLLRVCMHALTFLRDFVTFVLSAEIISGRTAWTWGIISSCLVTPSVPSSSSSSSSSVAHKHNVRTYVWAASEEAVVKRRAQYSTSRDGRTDELSVCSTRTCVQLSLWLLCSCWPSLHVWAYGDHISYEFKQIAILQ